MLTQFNRIFELKYEHTRKGGSYHIEIKNGILYITFQYSKGFRDWIYNFTFPKRAYKKGDDKWYVHRGFLSVWKDIETNIKEFMQQLDDIKPIVIISGYSHGGALAVLCHEWFKYHYNTDVYTYAFGAPRIIHGRIPQALRERLQDCVVVNNRFDMVSHLPPRVLGFKDYPNIITLNEEYTNFKPIHEHTRTGYIKAITNYIHNIIMR